MKYGGRPTILDTRDYSYLRTFGALSKEQIKRLPENYDVDRGLTMPDQNKLDPFSCTAYTTCDMGTDQDGIIYAPKYTYMKTLFMQGLPPETNGSDIRPALQSATVYGLLPDAHMPEHLRDRDEDFTAKQSNWPNGIDAIAGKLEHRKGKYFNVYNDGGLNWFESFMSALWTNRGDKRAISVGIPWICSYADDGTMLMPAPDLIAAAKSNPWKVGWHNVKVSGWRYRNGRRVLRVKPWQGEKFGDGGWVYMPEDVCEALMEIRGSCAFTQKDATAEDIQTIKIGILETILKYLSMILGRKHYA